MYFILESVRTVSCRRMTRVYGESFDVFVYFLNYTVRISGRTGNQPHLERSLFATMFSRLLRNQGAKPTITDD